MVVLVLCCLQPAIAGWASGDAISAILHKKAPSSVQYERWVGNVSEACIDAYASLAASHDRYGVNRLERVVDASGKLGAGLLDGNVYVQGSYDECLDTGDTQFCTLEAVKASQPSSPLLVIQTCLPSNCSRSDLLYVLELLDEALLDLLGPGGVVLLPVTCTSQKHPPFNAGAVVMVVVCVVFVVLAGLGTTVHWADDQLRVAARATWSRDSLNTSGKDEEGGGGGASGEKLPLLSRLASYKQRRGASDPPTKDPFPVRLAKCFSLLKNVPTILSTHQPASAITSLNGIRTLSMFWVITGHTFYFFSVSNNVKNPLLFLRYIAGRYSFQAIINAYFSVDSFFFLSGLLVSYLTLREMSRKNGRFPLLTFYVHRLLRLTPTYAFLLFFYWLLQMHLSDGPWYPTIAGVDSQPYNTCAKYWWTNLLYINNLYPSDVPAPESCMGWSWYLANDMQFYVVSPLMIVLLYHSLPLGLLSVGVFLLSCLTATGAIAGYYGYSASMYAGDQPSDPSQSLELYGRPYSRIAPYLVGIAVGYVFFKDHRIRVKGHRWLTLLLHVAMLLVAGVLLLETVYGLYNIYPPHNHMLSSTASVMYLTFSRFAWGLGLALLVFVCHSGYGGLINSFLSMGFWVPLSRLTFTAYLVHPIVGMAIVGGRRDPFYYTDIGVSIFVVGYVAMAYAAAGLVAAFVEFPLSNVELLVFSVLGIQRGSSTRNPVATQAVPSGTDVSVPHESKHA